VNAPVTDRISAAPSDDGLVLLANQAMRARRRPVMIAVIWAWYALWGFILAWPASRLVAEAYGAHPAADAPIFRPGGLELFDVVIHSQRAFAALRGHVLLVLPVVLLAGLLPLSALMTSIAYTTRDRRSPRFRQLVVRAAASFKPMLLLLVLATIFELTFVGLGSGLGLWAGEGLTATFGDARADQIGVLITVVFVLLSMTVGVLHDLARAAVIRFQVSGLRAIVLGWNAYRRHPIVSFWSWAWRAAAGVVPIVAGSVVAERLGGRGGAGFLMLVAMHQLVIGARVALRTSWLAKAIRSVDHAHRVIRSPRAPSLIEPAPPSLASGLGTSETAARSDGPDAPIPDRGA
jgi:hypothetical protein